MSIDVYLEKRKLKGRKRNGQHKVRYSVRWWGKDEKTGQSVFKGESTGTGDATQAEEYRKAKKGPN